MKAMLSENKDRRSRRDRENLGSLFDDRRYSNRRRKISVSKDNKKVLNISTNVFSKAGSYLESRRKSKSRKLEKKKTKKLV